MNENVNEQGLETTEQNVEETAQKEQTFTKEEVLALIQSESDKRVSQALKTQQKKYEKQLSLSKLDGSESAKKLKSKLLSIFSFSTFFFLMSLVNISLDVSGIDLNTSVKDTVISS